MIVAELKPIDEIASLIAGKSKVLVLGCGGCVTVCNTGGDRQAQTLVSQLRMRAKGAGELVEIEGLTITRQCDREFIDETRERLSEFDIVLSMACGAGVQLMNELTGDAVRTVPAMNTTFLGANTAPGVWTENCRGCGQCVLAETAGICPMTRCAKSLVNGPCGGTNKGKCEVSNEIDCAWHLIVKRLGELGELERARPLKEPVDWSKTGEGARRRLVREEFTESGK